MEKNKFLLLPPEIPEINLGSLLIEFFDMNHLGFQLKRESPELCDQNREHRTGQNNA